MPVNSSMKYAKANVEIISEATGISNIFSLYPINDIDIATSINMSGISKASNMVMPSI